MEEGWDIKLETTFDQRDKPIRKAESAKPSNFSLPYKQQQEVLSHLEGSVHRSLQQPLFCETPDSVRTEGEFIFACITFSVRRSSADQKISDARLLILEKSCDELSF